mmetsp:Transcript_25365/g.41730  ORF Transcript_25365/g.41730 Transcript_25365/m.41730 type:complete len:336 (-) Transcript_25365:6-1013(-)
MMSASPGLCSWKRMCWLTIGLIWLFSVGLFTEDVWSSNSFKATSLIPVEKSFICHWEDAQNSTGDGLITALDVKYLPPLTQESAECLKSLLADFEANPLAGVVLMIDPRIHPMMEPVVRNMMEHVPSSWKIQIVTSMTAMAHYKVLFKKELSEGKILFRDVGQEQIPYSGHHAAISYNWILFSHIFWDAIIHENILLIHPDTWICVNGTDGILEWMKYDYVGAPFGHTPRGGIRVGNGGFSFRKRSAMKKAISFFHDNKIPESEVFNGRNEDEMFGNVIHNDVKGLVPSAEEALRFAVETQFYDKPFGVHKYWGFLGRDKCIILKRWCNNPQWNE